jgi:hypothetical protein
MGAESARATEQTPAVAIIRALFSMNARRERLMDHLSFQMTLV